MNRIELKISFQCMGGLNGLPGYIEKDKVRWWRGVERGGDKFMFICFDSIFRNGLGRERFELN